MTFKKLALGILIVASGFGPELVQAQTSSGARSAIVDVRHQMRELELERRALDSSAEGQLISGKRFGGVVLLGVGAAFGAGALLGNLAMRNGCINCDSDPARTFGIAMSLLGTAFLVTGLSLLLRGTGQRYRLMRESTQRLRQLQLRYRNAHRVYARSR